MIKHLAEVKAGKTIIKWSYKVTHRLNCTKFHNYYHKMKIKSRLLVVGFRFCKKIRYEYHKLNNLQNIQISNKSSVDEMKIPSFYGCSCRHSITCF